MHVGTSLFLSTTGVMLLGSGELGKEVIIALLCPGEEVIAVYCYANGNDTEMARENTKKATPLVRPVKG